MTTRAKQRSLKKSNRNKAVTQLREHLSEFLLNYESELTVRDINTPQEDTTIQQHLKKLDQLHSQGKLQDKQIGSCVLEYLNASFLLGIQPPEWVRKYYVNAYMGHTTFKHRTLDDAFHLPHRAPNAYKIEQRHYKALALFERGIQFADQYRPKDKLITKTAIKQCICDFLSIEMQTLNSVLKNPKWKGAISNKN